MESVFSNSPGAPPIKGFYGWRIMFSGMLILLFACGVGFYGQSVLVQPLQNLHGWSKGTVSTAATMFFLTSGIIGVWLGKKVDQQGSRQFIISGSLIFSLGLVLLSMVSQVWQLFASYILMSVGFTFVSNIPVNALITNWFERKRGFAMSIAMTGLSIGAIIMVPTMTILIMNLGIRYALWILAAVIPIVFIPIAAFVVKQRPSDIGQYPDGIKPEKRYTVYDDDNAVEFPGDKAWSRKEVFMTPAFWALVITFFLSIGTQVSYLIHQISFLSEYLGNMNAAFAVSITAGASIFGRFALGMVADRVDKVKLTMACLLTQTIAIFLMALYQHPVVLYLGTFAFGLTMGSILMMQSLLVGDCFGLKSFSMVFGLVNFFTSIGSAFGPMIAGVLFDLTSSYQTAFKIFSVCSLLATITVSFAKPSKQFAR